MREKLGVTIEGPHEADKYLLDNLPQSGARYGMLTAREVTPDRWLKDFADAGFKPEIHDLILKKNAIRALRLDAK